MRYLLITLTAVMLTAAASAETAVDWRTSISRSLDNTLTVNWQERKAAEALAYVAKASGVTITVDPAVVARLTDVKVTISVADRPLKTVLGLVLKAAGLRYTLRDGGIYVSSPERLVMMLLSGEDGTEVAEAEPMTEADALALVSNEDVAADIPDLSNPYDALGFEPWKKPVRAYRDPVTGIMQFPAPDVWVEAADKDNPRFMFQREPWFLKPEYLWELVYKKSGGLHERELLGRVAKLLAEHPEWTEEEVLKQLLTLSQAAK